MKPNQPSQRRLAITRTQLAHIAALSITLAILTSLTLTPFPRYGSTAKTDQGPPSVNALDDTRPQAILSLRGTLGSNGWYTSNVEVSMYATGDDSASLVVEYAFYNQAWTTFEAPFFVSDEGQTVVYYRARDDTTGFVGETKRQSVDLDKTPPNGTVLIQGGAEDVFTNLVTLTLSVTDVPSGPTTPPPSGYIWGVPSGPADMRFSNDGISWSYWEPVASNKSWTLKTGAGNKTVYVQARDNAGLVSETFSDTINLITSGDSLPPVTEITVSGKKDTSGVYTSNVAITLSATDNLSGINLTEYSFDESTWTTYTAPFVISADGQISIYYRSHDLAGNAESTNSQTIDIDRTSESRPAISPLVVYAAAASTGLGILATILLLRRQRNLRKTPHTIGPLDRESASHTRRVDRSY